MINRKKIIIIRYIVMMKGIIIILVGNWDNVRIIVVIKLNVEEKVRIIEIVNNNCLVLFFCFLFFKLFRDVLFWIFLGIFLIGVLFNFFFIEFWKNENVFL